MKLAAHCRGILEQAEQRIKRIQLDAAGEPHAEPFDARLGVTRTRSSDGKCWKTMEKELRDKGLRNKSSREFEGPSVAPANGRCRETGDAS